MIEAVEDKLFQFLRTCLEPFTIPAALKAMGENVTNRTIAQVGDFIQFHRLAFGIDTDAKIDPADRKWLSRSGLFTGKPFVIRLTPREAAAGQMIPGSRFVPFVNPVLLPHELRLTFRGAPLERVLAPTGPEEVYPLYQLYGEEYVYQYLALDNPENEALFTDPEGDIPERFKVMAVDMTTVLWESGYKPGDLLCARVTDWDQGAVDLDLVAAESADSAVRAEWLRAFESSLLASFESLGPGASIDEQLAQAWFLGRDALFSPQAPTIRDFLQWTSNIGFEPYGVETRLWRRGKSIPAQGSWNMAVIATPETLAEQAFIHFGLPLSSFVLDAYVLDGLYRKESGIAGVMGRMVPSKPADYRFWMPVIEREVQASLRHFTPEYNWFADHETGVLRNRFIELHAALVRFVLSLQGHRLAPAHIPDQGAVVLGQIIAHTVSALESLSLPADANGETDALWASLEGMEDSFFDVKTQIQESLPEILRRRFSILKEGGSPDERQ
jgi:hypothetical protein